MKRFSLSKKLILYFSAFVFIIGSGIAMYAYIESAEILEEQVKKDMTSIAESMEGQVFIFYRLKRTLTANWSSDGYIRSYVEKIVKNQATLEDLEGLRAHLQDKRSTHPSVRLVDVLDRNMRVVFSLEEGRVGHDETEHLEGGSIEEFLAMRLGDAFVGRTMTVEQEDYHPSEPVFHTLAPVMNKGNNEVLGFILLHIDSMELNKIMKGEAQIEEGALSGQRFIIDQKTSEMYLVNSDKLMITPSRFVENSILNQKVDTEPVKKCLEDREEFSGSYTNYLGENVIGASMCFPGKNLILLAEINEDEIFYPLIKERNDFAIAGIFALIASIFLAILIARLFLRDLNSIVVAAKRVSSGDLSVRTSVKSKDELRDLSNAFNEMLDSIEESKSRVREAQIELEKVNKGLENKVKERTVELEKLKVGLEKVVDEKTSELQKKLIELEKFKELTVGRELKMVELKQKISSLSEKIERRAK